MGDQSRSLSRFRVLFEWTLRNYERQTGTELVKHPLAQRLRGCRSIESVVGVFQEQMPALGSYDDWDEDRIMKSLKGTVSVLYTLSTRTVLGKATSLPFPPTTAIHAALAILLVAVKGGNAGYGALADLLEAIERFLDHLHIYTKISPTRAMDENIIKIMMELLSTIALVTKQIKENRSIKFAKKLLGEKHVDSVLQRLDRLTQEEARTTAAQTLEVVYGLVQNMRVAMDDGKASGDNIRNALELLHQIASDLNRSKRDKLQQDIRSWLAPPDSSKNHNIACEMRHERTALWFIQGDTFLEWKLSAPGSLLWIHSKPGGGKSVLCSAIIEDIDAMRRSGLASLAFYYCDFREHQKKDRRGLLSSVLVQLCHQSDSYSDILSTFYAEHVRGLQQPSDDALARCVEDLLKTPSQPPVYLILDALDEFPNKFAMPPPRKKVLSLVEGLVDLQIANLRICVTSRPEADIKSVLYPLSFRVVSLHDESGQIEDIDNYIKSVVNTDSNMRRWNVEDKQLVIDVLTKKADGMFRWAYCQLVHLRDCLPARISRSLAELPETLDETYERTLRDIKSNWEYAHRLFQCVAVASRPLRVEELAEFLAFDFDVGPIPKFHEKWRMEDPVHGVLSTCSSLLSIVDVEGSQAVQFSHFSVKEFLTSTRLAETTDTTVRRYHISVTSAHTLAAQACLGILLHLDKKITRDSLRRFPLSEYAAKHWVDHAQFEHVMPNVEEGIKRLFDPNKPHLAIWVWIYDPAGLWHTKKRGQRPPHLSGTPLHYAAICGLHATTKYLINEHSLDVNARGIYKESTPLHQASDKGHVEVVRVLLEHGADVTAQNEDKLTPLHRASRSGREEIVRVLLEHGADAAAQDKNRMTPLHWASARGHLDVSCILLERGEDAEARDKDGWTPLHHAAFEGRVDIARILLKHGVDATVQDKNGRTPFHRSESEGHTRVSRVLREQGVDVTAQDVDGRTVLHRASIGGHVEIVRSLLDRGAVATVRDWNGKTPLHYASRKGFLEVARALLENGADTTVRDQNDCTPMDLARRNGQEELVQILLRYDQNVTDKASASASTSEDDSSGNSSRERRERKERVSRKMRVSDFEVMRVLGEGCAGKMLLVRHKSRSDLYALKAITKRHVLMHQQLQHTLTEQAVLRRMAAEGANPFVVKLWWSFHDKENLFLVMDFHPGGDLATQLARWGRLGRDRARFYAAEIVEGVEGLHTAGVVYRDLKPENILIAADGHIVLTDFGLSKEFPRRAVQHTTPATPPMAGTLNWMKENKELAAPWPSRHADTTNTFCGTAEYLAPEVIQGLPYSYEVDWWSFGTMLYEMLMGITPFWADNHSDMQVRVLQDELQLPDERAMDQDTKSLIRELLQRNPALRINEPRIKRHPYFSMIDWSHVYYKRYIPPYIPPIDPSNASDTQNFDDSFLDMEPVINDENDMDTDQEREQTDQEPTDGEDSVPTPSQSRSSDSVHPPNDLMDVFDGYSFSGRHSVIIEDEEDVSEEEAFTGPDIHHKEKKKPSASKPRGRRPKRNRREKSGVPALYRDLSDANDESDVRTAPDEEEEDWDVFEADGEERNGARSNGSFARGVVDRYRLSVFRNGSTPKSTGTGEAAGLSALDGPTTPNPTRGRTDALHFRRTPKDLLHTKSLLPVSKSFLSRGKLFMISDHSSHSTISTTQSLHTARSTLGEPSLKSKESNISVGGGARSSSNTSTRGYAPTASDPDIIETVRVPHLVADEQERYQKNNKKLKRGAEKMLSLFASPR